MSALTNGIATEAEAASISEMTGVTSNRLVTRTNLPVYFCRLVANPSVSYATFQCVKYSDIEKAVLRFYLRDAVSNLAITSDDVVIKIGNTTYTSDGAGGTSQYTRSNNLYTIPNVYLVSFSLEITLTGYRNYGPATVTFDNLVDDTIALIPEASTAEMLAYVNWNHLNSQGQSIGYDIDTHVVIFGPVSSEDLTLERKGEVWYSGKTYEDSHIKVVLDIDDTGSGQTVSGVTIYGETITITPKTPEGGTSLYAYYVLYYVQYDFEHHSSSPVANPFAEREASVRVTDKNGTVTTCTPPEVQTVGAFWRIFTFQNGAITSNPNEVDNTNTGNWELKQGL